MKKKIVIIEDKYGFPLEAVQEAAAKWYIVDWAGNVKFGGEEFASFDEGEAFLAEKLGDKYETERDEFSVVQASGVKDKSFLDPNDPRGGKKLADPIEEMATAKSTIKKYEGLKNKKVWTKQEILGVAHQMSGLGRGYGSHENMDEELKYILHELVEMFKEGKTVDITPEQSQQGIAWLQKNIINAKGELRDTGMVRDAGFTGETADVIKNFKKFELVGFHEDEQSHSYSPVYRTIAKDGSSFDYSVSGGWGGAHIILH